MIKTITIDGKDILFKSNAATPIRYKQQTGSDYFADILKMHAISEFAGAKEVPVEVLKTLDFDVFYNILWAMAKTADQSIPEPLAWFDTFDEFPIFDILPEVMELLAKNLQVSKKK